MHSRWSCVPTRGEEGRRAGVTRGVTKSWLSPRSPSHPRPRMPVRQPSPPLQPQHLRSVLLEPHLLAPRATPPRPGCALPGTGRHTQVCANPFWVPRTCMFRHALQKGGSSLTCRLFAGLGALSARVPMKRSTYPKDARKDKVVAREDAGGALHRNRDTANRGESANRKKEPSARDGDPKGVKVAQTRRGNRKCNGHSLGAAQERRPTPQQPAPAIPPRPPRAQGPPPCRRFRRAWRRRCSGGSGAAACGDTSPRK